MASPDYDRPNVGMPEMITDELEGLEGMVDSIPEEIPFAPSSFVPEIKEDKKPEKQKQDNRAQVD